MDPSLANIVPWSHGLAALGHLVVVVHLARGISPAQRDATAAALVAAVAMAGAWAGAGLLLAQNNGPHAGPIPDLLDTLRYGAWFAFVILLLHPAPASARHAATPRPPWLAWTAGGLVGFALVCQGILLATDTPLPLTRRASQYAALALAVYGLALVEQLFRNTTADSRWNVKPLGIGLAAAFAFDLYFHSTTLLFGGVDTDAFIARALAHTLVLPLIVLSFHRARARKLQVTLSRTAAFRTTTFAAAGLYLLAAAAAGYYVRYLGGSWGGALQLFVLFAALVLLLLLTFSGAMRARLRVLVDKHFFRYRYDYREEWLKFTRALSDEGDARQIGQQVIRGLADMVESPAGALWLREADGERLTQAALWNMPAATATEDADGPLAGFLQDSGWVIDLEEFRHRPGRYQGLALPDWLLQLPNAWLVVPLGTAGDLIGFVVLTTARAPLDVNWEVNDLLRTAGRQAAVFLARLQATEALLEARKFESFNRMSAFVVHDLKNIVTQLSLLLRNAERHGENAEFRRDMLLTVQHAVDRMRQLMLQLREGAPPVTAGHGGVPLAEVARRVQKAKAPQAPAIEVDIREPVVARGDEERLERVIGHLVQNALDATPADGRVWIAVGRDAGMAQVEVGDSGHGMPAGFVRERLFKPFQTTKPAGMGIGAYESRQYVRELGGDIGVESVENVGTRFRVRLPLIDVRKTSDLNPVETP